MKVKKSSWIILIGVVAFLMLVTIVWASAPASGPSAPLQATPGLDADKVDGHHAAASWWSAANRTNKVLWANASGNVHWKAMPASALNNRYVNDDRQETITASGTGNAFGDAVLNIDNTAPSWAGGMGLYSRVATSSAVRGESGHIGVVGSGNSRGVVGTATTGIGGDFQSDDGYGIRVNSDGTNHWDHAGYFTSDWGYGIYAQSDENMGLRAEAGNVSGLSRGAGAVGVVGIGENGGVFASGGGSSYGVYGISVSGTAIRGRSDHGNLIELHDGSPSNQRFRVTNAGHVYADGNYYGAGGVFAGSADFSEMVLPGEPDLMPGDVLAIDSDGRMVRSREPYETTVAGIYSTEPGFVAGSRFDEDGNPLEPEAIPLALVGIVPVNVSAENGAIQPGDLLVASSTPGHAMGAGANPPVGTVLGKALEPFDSGTGVILVLVTLQ